jgi:hypothetical protein
MPSYIVQAVAADNGAAATTVTVNIAATAAGNRLIAVVGRESRSVTGFTAGSWTKASGTVAGSSQAPAAWSQKNIAAGITSVTANLSSSLGTVMFILEIGGLDESADFDKSNWSVAETSATWSSGATGALTTATQMLIACAATAAGSSNNFAADSPFTAVSGTGITSGHHGNTSEGDDLFVCYQHVSASTTQTATGTCNNIQKLAGIVSMNDRLAFAGGWLA